MKTNNIGKRCLIIDSAIAALQGRGATIVDDDDRSYHVIVDTPLYQFGHFKNKKDFYPPKFKCKIL